MEFRTRSSIIISVKFLLLRIFHDKYRKVWKYSSNDFSKNYSFHRPIQFFRLELSNLHWTTLHALCWPPQVDARENKFAIAIMSRTEDQGIFGMGIMKKEFVYLRSWSHAVCKAYLWVYHAKNTLYKNITKMIFLEFRPPSLAVEYLSGVSGPHLSQTHFLSSGNLWRHTVTSRQTCVCGGGEQTAMVLW